MADFRTQLITLAGVASIFAGMAYGQANCSVGAANALFIRAEGNTEQVGDTTITCTVPAGNTAVTAGQMVNLTVYMSPTVSITSAVLGTGSSAKSETQAGVTANFVAGGGAPSVYGTVSGSNVTFSNIVLPAIAVSGSTTLTITNIRVAASTLASGSGIPAAVSETIFTSGTGVVPGVIGPISVAYVQSALTGVKSKSAMQNPICDETATWSANGAFNTNWNIFLGEGFADAFKIRGTAAGNATLGSEFANHTETGYGVSVNGGNQASSGTRIKLVFNNIPAGVTVWVPVTETSNGGTITLTTSETGAYSPVAGSTANGAPGSTSDKTAGTGVSAALSVTNGSGTAIYETTAASTSAPAAFVLPIYLSAAAGALPAPASAITTTISLAPIGAASNIPNFVSGASTKTVNGGSFVACTTTLIFPFVTNQLGFDTGIAISNMSSDDLPLSTAVPASGTCSLAFWGSAAPANDFTTPTVATGTSYTSAVSSLAPGFQGYMTANCNFLYAHGFAYVVYDLTQNNGAAMGYLASVVSADRGSQIQTLTDNFGDVDLVSTNSTVSSTTPESWGH